MNLSGQFKVMMKGSKLLYIFLAVIFIVLPSIKLKSTIDPELSARFLLTSLFFFLLSAYFVFSVNGKIELNKSAYQLSILLLSIIIWTAVSMILSVNKGDAFAEWLRLAGLYSVLFISYFIFKKSSNIIVLISRASAFAVIIFSIYGFVQLYSAMHVQQVGKNYQVSGLVNSSLANKNFFSEVLVLLFPFLILGLIRDNMKWKTFFCLNILASLFFIFFLQTLSAWLGILFSILIYLIVSYRLKISPFDNHKTSRYKRAITACLLIIIIGGALLYSRTSNYKWLVSKYKNVVEYIHHPELISATRLENNNSIFERLLIWRNSMRMIADHPLIGVGLNNWKLVYPEYGVAGTQYINSGFINYEHPHNDYLLIWAEQGPIGIFLFISLIVFTIYVAVKKFRNGDKQVLLLLICVVFSFCIMSLFGYPRSRYFSMIVLMIATALIMLPGKDEEVKEFSPRVIFFLLLLLFITGSVSAYYKINGEIHLKNTLIDQINSNYDRMIREADKAESWFFPLDNSSTPISWYKGMALFNKGNIPDAIIQYEKAVQINPGHRRILNDLATSYERTGEKTKAVFYYKKALEITPLFIEANLNISAAYYNMSNYDSAFYFIDKIYKLPMSMGEENTYNKFLDAILIAEAVTHMNNSTDTAIINRSQSVISNKKLLIEMYNSSKKENTSFVNYFNNYMEASKK